MKLAKVSIIIPVYNVEPYLTECINSAVSQDYKNIEIIAVNDGSTDGSLAILQNFAKKYLNIIVINIPNQGVSVARNVGLENATGDYVLFLDSDDWIDAKTVSLCMKKMALYQVDLVFFSATPFCDGVDPTVIERYSYERNATLSEKSLPARNFFSESFESNNYIVNPCVYIFNRKKSAGLRFYPGIWHEDNLFTTKLLLDGNILTVASIPDRLFNRRVRPESITTRKKQEKHIDGFLTVAEVLARHDLIKGSSPAAKALNRFVAMLTRDALNLCSEVHGNKLPFYTRKRAILLVAKMNIRHLKVKTILACLMPDLLAVGRSIRGVVRQVMNVKFKSRT